MIKNTYVFGTIINITGNYNEDCKKEILKFLYELDDLCSIYKDTSDICKINQAHDYVSVDRKVLDMIQKSIYYSYITHGDMDITCHPLLIGIMDLSLVNYQNILIKNQTVKLKIPGMAINLGSMVKGYATDVIVTILDKYGIENAMIDLGGNIYVKGLDNGSFWKVGIVNPTVQNHSSVGYLSLTNKSVVTSGINERGLHIVNPHNGQLVNNGLWSVSIVADSSMDAEGLSTAYFVKGLKGLEEIKKYPKIGLIYIDQKKNIYLSDNLKTKFILLNKKFKIKEYKNEKI